MATFLRGILAQAWVQRCVHQSKHRAKDKAVPQDSETEHGRREDHEGLGVRRIKVEAKNLQTPRGIPTPTPQKAGPSAEGTEAVAPPSRRQRRRQVASQPPC